MTEEKEPKLRAHYVPFWSHEASCYEAVNVKGTARFVTFGEGKFRLLDALGLSATDEAKPAQYTPEPYTFTEEPTTTDTLPSLYERTLAFWRDYWAHPDMATVQFLALYIVYTYMVVKGPGCVQVFLVGGIRSGKTTAQQLAGYIGYRAFGGVAPSEAAIYRTLGYEVEYAPLVIIREYEKASETMKLISRESDVPGASVARCDKDDDKQTVNYYHTYGSRICGANKLPDDFTAADNDRLHIIKSVHMRPKRPRAELYRNRDVMKAWGELRNDLLLWRVANYSTLDFPMDDPKGEISEGRDWEHYGGVITLAALISPELEATIRQHVGKAMKAAAKNSKAGIESILANAVTALAEATGVNTTLDGVRLAFAQIWDELKAECMPLYENGVVNPAKLIAPDGRVITTTSIGRMLSDNLFGQRDQWRNEEGRQLKGYIWTDETLKTLLGIAGRTLTADGSKSGLSSNVTGVTGVTGLEGSGGLKDGETPINETPSPATPPTPPNTPQTSNSGNTGNKEAAEA